MAVEQSQKAPWNAEQVENLKTYQQNRWVHPFTCGNRSAPGHEEYAEKHQERDVGLLIPTPSGWVCPVCDYTQDWAHSFMLDGSASRVSEKMETLLSSAKK